MRKRLAMAAVVVLDTAFLAVAIWSATNGDKDNVKIFGAATLVVTGVGLVMDMLWKDKAEQPR